MKKKIIISHAYGPDNRGDHELLEKLLEIIKEKYGKELKITIFSSFPEKSKQVFNDEKLFFEKSPVSFAGLEKSFLNYFKISRSFFGYIFNHFTQVALFLNKDEKRKVEALKEADLIFYCPGGYLYSNGRSFYINILNGILLKAGKAPIIFSPMSIGPFYNRLDSKICKYLLNTADRIFARESYSFDLVRTMGFNNVHLTTDLAWYNSEIYEFKKDLTWENSYVITIIDWDYNDVGNQAFYKDRYYQEIIECCKFLFAKSGNKVVLYNQVGTGKGNSHDEKLIKRLIHSIPEYVKFDEEELTPHVLKNRLHKCEGLIASRFHSALFAIQAECPFIALSYQPKAEYILRDLGLDKLSRKIHEFDGKETAFSLSEQVQDKLKFKEILKSVKTKSKSLIEENFLKELPHL